MDTDTDTDIDDVSLTDLDLDLDLDNSWLAKADLRVSEYIPFYKKDVTSLDVVYIYIAQSDPSSSPSPSQTVVRVSKNTITLDTPNQLTMHQLHTKCTPTAPYVPWKKYLFSVSSLDETTLPAFVDGRDEFADDVSTTRGFFRDITTTDPTSDIYLGQTIYSLHDVNTLYILARATTQPTHHHRKKLTLKNRINTSPRRRTRRIFI